MTIINNKKLLRQKINQIELDNTNLLLMSSGNFSGLDIKSII